ncbi:MAG: SprT-like domain-containing protein [Desulfatiglandales bacterium]
MGIKGASDKWDSEGLKKRLSHLLNAPLSLTITDNLRSMISVLRKDAAYLLRLHHMFLDADEAVLTSLAHYISGGNSCQVKSDLRHFIERHAYSVRKLARPARARRHNIHVQGRYFDLQKTFSRLNRDYFQNRMDCRITWGNRKRKTGKASIRLGSYSQQTQTIRVNPILDRASVPAFVLDHIIYHEMLHHALGFVNKNGRRLVHHQRFRELERGFVRHEDARLWLKRHLPGLIAPRA